MDDTALGQLAELVIGRAVVDERIAQVIGAPASAGNIGEFVAAEIFDIELAPTKVQFGYDGHFHSGELAGKSVNIKRYSRLQYMLDVHDVDDACDYYLVLTGPRGSGGKGAFPWHIDRAFLFDASALLQELRERGVKIGIASGVRKAAWEAQIFPPTDITPLTLKSEQRAALELFGKRAHQAVRGEIA